MTDGTYTLSGNNIFITNGEHDLCENIIHPVLTRKLGRKKGRDAGIWLIELKSQAAARIQGQESCRNLTLSGNCEIIYLKIGNRIPPCCGKLMELLD